MAEYCRPANADLLFLCDGGRKRIFAHRVRLAFYDLPKEGLSSVKSLGLPVTSPTTHNSATPILASQVIFALHSPLLGNIFSETHLQGEEMVKILLPDFRAEDVADFVKFFYTGEIK